MLKVCRWLLCFTLFKEPSRTHLSLFCIPLIYLFFASCSQAVSNFIVVFLRLLTSATIRTDPLSYAPFLFHPETGTEIAPQKFCEGFVEACGKEAGSPHFVFCLCRVLRIDVCMRL